MATSRDVKMTLSVDTLGEDGVKSLQQSIQSLANQGGSAAPEFQKLADEVGRLGEQSKSLQAFRDLAAATDDLKVKQRDAALTSSQMAAKLDALKGATDEAKTKQKEASAALIEGQKAALEAGTAIRTLKTDYDNAGKQTVEYRTELQRLLTAQSASKSELIDLRAAQQAANAAVTAATSEQNKAETAYGRTAKSAKEVADALTKQEAVLREAAAATEKLGLSTADVASSEGALISALNAAGNAAQQHTARIKEMAESDRLLAIEKQGLEELTRRGAAALQAETLAQRDAARSNAEYDASLAKVNAEKAKAVETSAQWQREAEAIVNASLATQKFESDTARLIAVEQQLAAIKVFNQQAEDARKLVQAAEYVQFWTDTLNKSEVAAKQVQGAFNTLNVRSAEAIRADLAAVHNALETVRAQSVTTGTSMTGAFAAGQAKVNALELELRQLNGTLTRSDKLAELMKNSMGQITAGNVIADGVGYLVNKVKELGVAFLDTIVQGDQLRRGLTAIYKDTGLVAQQIDFLKKSSSESGVAFSALVKDFVRFSASMQSANIPLAESNNLFKAVTAASASLGLGAEETAGALNALGQMASKGTVSMEELRQQLGDRLPGAMGLTAKGLGITEAQLVSLVSTGGLATRDFIVPFTNALKGLQGETDGLVPTWERFKGALAGVATGIGDAGAIVFLTGVLKALGGTVAAVAFGFSTLLEGLFLVGSGVTALAARLTGDTKAWEFFADQVEKANRRMAGQADALDAMLDPSAKAKAATEVHTVAMTAHTAELVKSINTNAQLSAAQKLVALSTALAGDATLDAGAKFVQFNVVAVELLKTQAAQTESFGKLAKAAKEQGDTLVMLAKLSGDETMARNAGVKAAELHRDALEKVSKSQASEVEMLTGQKAALLENAAGRQGGTEAVKTQVTALDDLIKKAQAEAEQSKQATIAANAEVLTRKVQIDSLKDHSKELGSLKSAMDDAAATLVAYEKFAKDGLFTDEQVTAVREKLTVATARYNDALGDSVRMITAESNVKQANYNVTLASLSVHGQAYDKLAAASRASGDLAMATYYEIEAKKVQIAVTRLTAEAKGKEAEASIMAANAEYKALEATGALTAEKKLEIEARLLNAKAKQIEAGASVEIIAALEREVTAIRNGTNARQESNGVTGTNTTVKLNNAAATHKQADAEERLRRVNNSPVANRDKISEENPYGLTSDGLKANKDVSAAGTFGNSIPLDQANRLLMATKSGQSVSMTQAEYTAAKKQAADAYEFMQAMSRSGSSAASPEFIQAAQALMNAANTARVNVTDGNTTASGSSKTVNITINGRSQSVNVASAADATALTAMLRSLETAANTAS